MRFGGMAIVSQAFPNYSRELREASAIFWFSRIYSGCLSGGFLLETLPADIEQTIDFNHQFEKAFRILLNRSLGAQRHPGFSDPRVSVGGCSL